MRLYTLINAQKATMYEFKNIYTLDEALKLWALHQMETDIERGRAKETEKKVNRN